MKNFASLLLVSLMIVGQGNSAPEEGLVCQGQFQSAVSEALALRKAFQAKSAEVKRFLDTCERAVADDCCQIKKILPMSKTGIYQIRDPCAGNNTFNLAKIYTRCDLETDGGGWIVIQRRNTSLATVNFTRNWEDYVNGFGDLDGEFWIGLNNIYQLTNQQEVELQISVWNDAEPSITWNYQTFRISGPENKYRLTLGGSTGDGSDRLAYHNGQYFSTYDRDNDLWNSNCAYVYQGGWWYRSCWASNLNGQPLYWTGVFTNSVMMIRSKTCSLG